MAHDGESYLDRSADDQRGSRHNQQELTGLLGVTRATIHEWQDDGLPYAVREWGNEYHLPAVIRWLHRRSLIGGDETPKDRLARVQADRIEIEIARERKEVIPASEIAEAWARIVMTVRAGILNLPSNAHALEATPGVEAKYDLLQSRCNDLLDNLSGSADEIIDSANDAEVRASAENERSGVGGK